MPTNVPSLSISKHSVGSPLVSAVAAIAHATVIQSSLGKPTSRQDLLGQLEDLADRHGGAPSRSDKNENSAFDTLVGSIRGLESPTEKARLSSSLTTIARSLEHSDIATKLERRALNYAETIECLDERVEELAAFVTNVSGLPEDREDVEGALQRATELAKALEGPSRNELCARLANAQGILRYGIAPVTSDSESDPSNGEQITRGAVESSHIAGSPARTEPTSKNAKTHAVHAPEKTHLVREVEERTSEIDAPPSVPEGFVDPTQGIAFPTKRRRRG